MPWPTYTLYQYAKILCHSANRLLLPVSEISCIAAAYNSHQLAAAYTASSGLPCSSILWCSFCFPLHARWHHNSLSTYYGLYWPLLYIGIVFLHCICTACCFIYPPPYLICEQSYSLYSSPYLLCWSLLTFSVILLWPSMHWAPSKFLLLRQCNSVYSSLDVIEFSCRYCHISVSYLRPWCSWPLHFTPAAVPELCMSIDIVIARNILHGCLVCGVFCYRYMSSQLNNRSHSHPFNCWYCCCWLPQLSDPNDPMKMEIFYPVLIWNTAIWSIMDFLFSCLMHAHESIVENIFLSFCGKLQVGWDESIVVSCLAFYIFA